MHFYLLLFSGALKADKLSTEENQIEFGKSKGASAAFLSTANFPTDKMS
jgi:hypothetical protein